MTTQAQAVKVLNANRGIIQTAVAKKRLKATKRTVPKTKTRRKRRKKRRRKR